MCEFGKIVLIASYTTTLASMLIDPPSKSPSKGDCIGYLKGSNVSEKIAASKGNSCIRPYSSPDQFNDALSKGFKNGGVDYIVAEMSYARNFFVEYPSGGYHLISYESVSNGLSFAFPRGSKLVGEITDAITKLREEGRLKDKWFKAKESSLMPQGVPKVVVNNGDKTLKRGTFDGLFIINGGALGLGILMHLIRMFHEEISIRIFALGRIVDLVKDRFRLMFPFPFRGVRSTVEVRPSI